MSGGPSIADAGSTGVFLGGGADADAAAPARVPGTPPEARARPARRRIGYLDGLRGWSAVFVVVHHLHQELTYRGDLPHRFLRATKWMQLGHFAVAVFIVLSGYSLMLPVADHPEHQLAGGMRRYLGRRARRILPPYYVALALTLLLLWFVPSMRRPMGWSWDLCVPVNTAAVISHALLVHNLNTATALKICGPMWSVATEWQIYFAFPLLLLPLWQRAGGILTSAIGLGLGVLIDRASGGVTVNACPWYLGLFAMGMWAAEGRPRTAEGTATDGRLAHRAFAGAVAAFTLMLTLVKLRPWWLISADAAAGAAAAGMLVALAHASPGTWLVRLLSNPLSTLLGRCSYSLYLVHVPVIAAVHVWLRAVASPSPLGRLIFLPPLALLATAACTYVLYVGVERRFLNNVSGRSK